jgi:putative endonuclease
MFYIYILYSVSFDKYYVGFTNNLERRLMEHNTTESITYTSKHRPWVMKAAFECSLSESEAVRIERFIKRQKSRKLIELLCNPTFAPTGELAQLVRVPHVRD